MKLSLGFCGLLLVILACVNSSPVAKRETVDDLSPLNEVYVFQNDEEERSDRDKRKIGVIKLGVSNGIINFVFGKLDAFLDAKTKALTVLDESNKAKNAAFEIDNTKSATSEFINKFLAQKAKASSGSVGPLFSAGTTFLSSAKQGLTSAFVSKLAPLSSLSSGLVGKLSGSSGGSGGNGQDDGSSAGGFGAGGSGGSNSGSFLTGILGSIGSLSGSSSSNGGGVGGLGSLSSLSNSGLGGDSVNDNNGNGVDEFETDFPSVTDASSSNGANVGFGGGVGGKTGY